MPQRILVLGASGYIGQHLVRTLSRQGHQILAAARHVDRLAKLQLANVSCHKVDLSWPDNLPALLQDIDTVYFLVHSMGEGGDFIAQERQVALNVRDALREVPVKQLIFLSSLQAPPHEQSDHLRARQATADILREANVPVTELRAGIIVGAGSAAFEVMRDMVYNLPVLTPPRWVRSRTTPIALENLLHYLVALLDHPASEHRIFEAAGPEVLSYQQQFLLLGNDPLLLQESQDAVRQVAAAQGFEEHHTFSIDPNTDWNAIFSLCQAMSLFASRQTLLLLLPENGPNGAINEQLLTLTGLLHDDLLLIVRGNKLSKAQENAAWFTALANRSVQVTCQTPEQAQLPRWVAARAKQLNLELDDAANQVLCYCYEGNLLALAQALERLSLLWPDGKLTLPRVEQAVNDAAHFTPFHWVDALLMGKSKRALHILQQLRLEGSEPVILLRTLQRELLLLVNLKRQSAHTPLRALFDKHRVWQNRRGMMGEALNRLSQPQLRQAVQLLTRTELTLKQDYGQSVWAELEGLSLLLCHKPLADVFIDG